MKKILFSLLASVLIFPNLASATEISENLILQLPEDFTVKAGAEFSIPVMAAYDKTETCTEFYYDWRQTAGVEVKPLNEDVKAPKFKINTPGIYTFALSITEQCTEEEDSALTSADQEINITVEELTAEETGSWKKEFLPTEITLPADGLSWQVFNLFLTNESANATTKYPNNEQVEFLLKTNDETLKQNTGRYLLSGNKIENGLLGFTYFTPLVTDKSWQGGDVIIQAALSYGTVSVTVHLTPAQTTFSPRLTVAQVLDNPPYLIKNKEAVARVSLKWSEAETSKDAKVKISVNGIALEEKDKTYNYSYSDSEKSSHRDVVFARFTPTTDKVTITAEVTSNGQTSSVEQTFKVKTASTLNLNLAALKEGEWANQETVNLSSELETQLTELLTYLPTTEINFGDLENIPTYSRAELPSDSFILLPANFTDTLPTGLTLKIDSTETNLVKTYLSQFSTTDDLPAAGVKITTDDFTVLSSEGKTILSSGENITQEIFSNLLIKLTENATFSDLKTDHWAYSDIQKLVSNGVLSGYADNSLKPNAEVTRAEFLKMLLTAGNSNTTAAQNNTNFSDVDSSAWYTPYVELALKKNIVKGYADGSFQPQKSVTRAEAMKIIVLYAGFEVPTEITETEFSDVSTSDWFAPYVQVMHGKGIVGGYSDGTFHPGANITRAEAAKILSTIFY